MKNGAFPVVSVLGIVMGLMIGGCSTLRVYDLSGTPPFSEYVGKDVVLARDVILTDVSHSATEPFLVVMDPPPTDGRSQTQEEASAETKVTRLAAGTHVRVVSTWMTDALNCYTHFQHLISVFVVSEADGESLPSPLVVRFGHIPDTNFHWGNAPFMGTIRPAPWEPLTTPQLREFRRPKDLKPLKKKAADEIRGALRGT